LYTVVVAASYVVLIAAPDVLPAFKTRAAVADAEVLGFSDADVLRALEAITARKPRLVALERLFAATPRGAALINRIKADPSLAQTELRVLAHDSDYSRVLPRGTGPGGGSPTQTRAGGGEREPVVGAAAPSGPATSVDEEPRAKTEPAAAAATLEPQPLDQRGTRRAARFRMAHKVETLIDGNPATLLDLSSVGAQVISPTILRPNQRVRMALSDEAGMIRFNATIAWASFEIPPQIGPQYRAGIEFVDADGTTLDAFCSRHRKV
jgi:PilZ domain